ncbi:GNAT family N-acetyltransferase [Microbacterium sp. M1A1_1b]
MSDPVVPRLVGVGVVLRPFRAADAAMAVQLSRDPYVPLTGSLPAHADLRQAGQWVQRQQGRLAEGTGYSFAIADPADDRALGQIGLWLAGLDDGRLTAGYALAPSARGAGRAAAALTALTTFAWTIPAAHRVELFIEPWNAASIRTAEHAGYVREGLLRSPQVIGRHRRDMELFAAIRPTEPTPTAPRTP